MKLCGAEEKRHSTDSLSTPKANPKDLVFLLLMESFTVVLTSKIHLGMVGKKAGVELLSEKPFLLQKITQ